MAKRTGLHDADGVANATLVVLVMGLDLGGAVHDFAIQRMANAILNRDGDGLVHLVADDDANAGLAHTSYFRHNAISFPGYA